MATWLARLRTVGWKRHLSEPRYQLVLLRALAAKGLARRERTFHGTECVLDFLFPGQPPPQGHKQATRGPRLPDDIFSVIARYYWCGEP
mmetsp:Transcript_8334/g.24849  ORF Transcript_8334/g.24849 Transcript_8334/m.24849 type:complete len:89 (-) Transcript_8334:70-336(-)